MEQTEVMAIDYDQVLVFRTNIKSFEDKLSVQEKLNSIENILEWNVDTEDVDCVLRIVSRSLSYDCVISEIKQLGFECSELT